MGFFFKFSVYQKFPNYFLAEVKIKETDQSKGMQAQCRWHQSLEEGREISVRLLLSLYPMLQLFLLLFSRVKDFTSFYSTRERKNSPLKEKADGMHYSLYAFPFLKYSNCFSYSPNPGYHPSQLQHHDLLFCFSLLAQAFWPKPCSAHSF